LQYKQENAGQGASQRKGADIESASSLSSSEKKLEWPTLYQGPTLVGPLEFLHFQHHIRSRLQLGLCQPRTKEAAEKVI
jgi:hypothetical protein